MSNENQPSAFGTLCGLWIDGEDRAHFCVAEPDGRRVERETAFRSFAWFREAPDAVNFDGVAVEKLKGEGVFSYLAHASDSGVLASLAKAAGAGGVDQVKQPEAQFLMQHRARLYSDLPFGRLRRCQLDIETSSADGSFSDPSKPEDRVIAIGLRSEGSNRFLVLESFDDAGEKRLLEQFVQVLSEIDPDVVEGHNLFKFDLDYLRQRSKRFKVPCKWGRFGRQAFFRNSRLKVAERWIDFPRCDLPGRAVVDTFLLAQLYDITTRELSSYGLKDVAVHFGVTEEASEERTYIPGSEIAQVFRTDRERFLAYLGDDLRETAGIADLLLPTYFEQTKTFPILLQEATLRGTAGKVDLLLQEEYYHARHACPAPTEVAAFEGAFSRSFQEGVFHQVLHFDVASLYPSILLHLGRNPRNDTLGVFIPLLRSLREYRLRFKQLAKTAPTAEERAEAQARQANFKILINSFYGYLGFSGARFGDGDLAAEVTRMGRELLQRLIDEFSKLGCTILEADTDGIYLTSEAYFSDPEALLAKVQPILPEGIGLEYDGHYQSMFCYKAKNYALLSDSKIFFKGSALRSRGIEPYLKRLTDSLVRFLLGVPCEPPLEMLDEYRRMLLVREVPVRDLARSEILGMSPEAYERFIAEGGKPRRASAEVALLMNPRPKMGDKVSYYITAKAKGKTSDWQRARPLAAYDPHKAPYDPDYYLKKLDDWEERYGSFLGLNKNPAQGELF